MLFFSKMENSETSYINISYIHLPEYIKNSTLCNQFKQEEHDVDFLTITCPSKFYPKYKDDEILDIINYRFTNYKSIKDFRNLFNIFNYWGINISWFIDTLMQLPINNLQISISDMYDMYISQTVPLQFLSDICEELLPIILDDIRENVKFTIISDNYVINQRQSIFTRNLIEKIIIMCNNSFKNKISGEYLMEIFINDEKLCECFNKPFLDWKKYQKIADRCNSIRTLLILMLSFEKICKFTDDVYYIYDGSIRSFNKILEDRYFLSHSNIQNRIFELIEDNIEYFDFSFNFYCILKMNGDNFIIDDNNMIKRTLFECIIENIIATHNFSFEIIYNHEKFCNILSRVIEKSQKDITVYVSYIIEYMKPSNFSLEIMFDFARTDIILCLSRKFPHIKEYIINKYDWKNIKPVLHFFNPDEVKSFTVEKKMNIRLQNMKYYLRNF